MIQNKLTREFHSRTLKSRQTRETPILDPERNMVLNSQRVLSIQVDNQSSDEEKYVKRLQTQLSYSNKSSARQARNTILLQKFDSELYVGQDQIQALNKIYSEVKVEENLNLRCPNLKKYCKIFEKILDEEKFPVIDPNQKLLLIWNIIVLVLLVFFFFEIPVYITWGEDFWSEVLPHGFIDFCTVTSYIIFIFDVGLQFITAYYQQGYLITTKSQIANNYLRNNFIYDVIAIFAFGVRVNLGTSNFNWFCLLFYFKIFSFLDVSEKIEEILLLRRRIRALYSISKLMLFMFLGFDLFACFYFILGTWSVQQGYNSWVSRQGGNFGEIDLLSCHEQFFFSFYISLSTMTSTMGFGDITPLNTYECAICLFGIIFGLMIFTTSLNYNFLVYEEYNESSSQIFRSRIAINQFMKVNEVPIHLAQSVRQYLNQYWYEEGTRDYKLEHKTIAKLPSELREELMYNSYGKFLQEKEMFKSNFSRPFLKALSLEVQEIQYSKGETIFRDRTNELIDDNSFFFIVKGSVIIHPLKTTKFPEKTQLKKLTEGEHFGEWSFFTGMSRLASAEAESYSLMYYIKRDTFLKTLQRFDDDYESYCLIKDSLLLQNDLSVIGVECWTCGSQDHMSTNCNLTHYRPAVQKVVNQDIRVKQNQTRRAFVRDSKIKWSARLNQQFLVQKKRLTTLKVLGFYLKNQQRIIKKKSQIISSIYSPLTPNVKIKQDCESSVEIPVQELEQQQQSEGQKNEHPRYLDETIIYQNKEKLQRISGFEETGEQKKSKEEIQMHIKFSTFSMPQIKAGLLGFDEPYNFKRYKTFENKENLWSIGGELFKRE